MKKALLPVLAILSLGWNLSSCSSGPDVKKQAYAQLSDHRTFEEEFPTVWKGIESALRKYKIVNRDPSEVDEVAMKKLRHRSLETDWIFAQSNDKYVEYKVNGLPRKTYLQSRMKYKVNAQGVIGGVDVIVKTDEQVQKLNEDGSPSGWETSDQPDTARAADLLERIHLAILSAAP